MPSKKQNSKASTSKQDSSKKTPKSNRSKKIVSKPVSKTETAAEAGFSSEFLKHNILDFPVVGIGASAGGLEALMELFKKMPAKTGIAFIIVSHLDPSHISLLPELLQKNIKLKVSQITDNTKIKPDCVYIIPPNKDLKIIDGTLLLEEITGRQGLNLPIDSFFRSLAEDQGPNAIAVILSGTGSDGSLGIRAIKGELGMVIVQDEKSSKYDGMPKNAINTGLADYVLPPEKIPGQLLKYIKHSGSSKRIIEPISDPKISESLNSIFSILRIHTNHDFSHYKRNTISRRIERRMNVHQIEKISDYIRYLRENKNEIDILFKELLIGVTNFFRDPKAFAALKEELTEQLKDKSNEYTLRAWVPGCSSGEEPYSLAILCHEVKQELKKGFSIQIFGTDIDEDAISFARAGLYPPTISSDVDPERLKRYFTKEEDGQYRIKKLIRETVVFAPQDIIKDPPFTKLDLLSCRNLLIYLGTSLQKKLFPVFQYSLKPDGTLFLGSSETIGQFNDLFLSGDRKSKIFKRKPLSTASRNLLTLPVSYPPEEDETKGMESPEKGVQVTTSQLIETILQQSDTPPSLIIDNECNVIYIHGRTGKFLEPAEGTITNNIREMARPGLKTPLSAAIRKVNQHKQEVIASNLTLENDGGEPINIDLIVRPVMDQHSLRNLILVQFREIKSSKTSTKENRKSSTPSLSGKTASELEKELLYTKENLQTTIEELETANEELKSTNEELQSTNEELQSTNEEMETSKEELQSLNEESITVNAELQSRIDELSQINDDMKNLMDSTDIATIFLDQALCLRRFTPRAVDIVPLTSSDIGRPIKHFANNLVNVDLAEYGEQVLEDLVIKEVEAESKDGHFYQIRIRPYRTVNNVIDGVVIIFNNITESRKAKDILKSSENTLRQFMKSATYGFILLDEKLHQIEVNDKALEIGGLKRKDLTNMKLEDILPDIKTEGRLDQYNEVIKSGVPFYIDDFIAPKDKHVELTAFKVGAGLGIIINDITERKTLEAKQSELISVQKSQLKKKKTKS